MAARSATLELIQAAKLGDDTAFESLLQPLLDPAYRLACVMLHDRHAAEDAVQEAALKAWRKLGQLRDGAQMRPWFLAIVANQCRSARRSHLWPSARDIGEDRTAPAAEDEAIAGIELRQAVAAMDPDKRLSLALRWYLDLPIAEIAAVQSISVHAAESRLARATNELRTRLEAGRGRP